MFFLFLFFGIGGQTFGLFLTPFPEDEISDY